MPDFCEIVTADFHVYLWYAFQCRGGFPRIGMIGRVARVDAHAFAREQPRGRDAAFAQPDDRDETAGAAPGVRDETRRCRHRTLRVASAIIALSTPRM